MDNKPFHISYPFPHRINPYVDIIEDRIHQWMDSLQYVPTGIRAKLLAARFGTLTSCFLPNASLELLIPAGRLIFWFFVYDDIFGPRPADELRRINTRIIALLEGATPDAQDDEVYLQLIPLREELQPLVTPQWMARFIQNISDFVYAMVTDTQYSYKPIVDYPSFEEYISIREHIAGVYPVFDLVEIESGFIMPAEICSHPAIQRLKQLAVRLVFLANDLFSMEKEKEDHEAMNLVLIFYQQGGTLEEAYAKTVNIHDEYLSAFFQLRSSLPDFGPFNKPVLTYISNIELFIQGHLSWCRRTARYIV